MHIGTIHVWLIKTTCTVSKVLCSLPSPVCRLDDRKPQKTKWFGCRFRLHWSLMQKFNLSLTNQWQRKIRNVLFEFHLRVLHRSTLLICLVNVLGWDLEVDVSGFSVVAFPCLFWLLLCFYLFAHQHASLPLLLFLFSSNYCGMSVSEGA